MTNLNLIPQPGYRYCDICLSQYPERLASCPACERLVSSISTIVEASILHDEQSIEEQGRQLAKALAVANPAISGGSWERIVQILIGRIQHELCGQAEDRRMMSHVDNFLLRIFQIPMLSQRQTLP